MRLRINEPIDGALRRFKKLVERSGIKRELRKKRYYEKPSARRRHTERKRQRRINQQKALNDR